MKHLTILNSTAGNYSLREQDKICRALSGMEGKVLFTSNLSLLEQALQDQNEYSPDLLGIGGGDGTFSHTLTAVKEIWGYIPDYIAAYALGTMNNVAMPLEASDSIMDKIKQHTEWGDTRAVQLAKYIQKTVAEGEPPHVENLIPLNMNGRLGFNLGFGLIPKLVWSYYGRSREEYNRAEQELQASLPRKYEMVLEQIMAENLAARKSGIIQAATTAFHTTMGLLKRSSPISHFFNQPLDARLYLDGVEIDFFRPPTGIYIASYEQQNMGIFRGTPSPGARAIPGTMEVILTSASVGDIVNDLPTILRGKPIGNTQYLRTTELKIQSEQVIIGQMDGEFVVGKEFTIRPDTPLKFVSLR